jgi:hypothetical protein
VTVFRLGGATARERAERAVNEAQTSARIDQAEREFHAELDRIAPPPAPVLIEHPIDPELQSGESAKLGGAMQLRAPWRTN